MPIGSRLLRYLTRWAEGTPTGQARGSTPADLPGHTEQPSRPETPSVVLQAVLANAQLSAWETVALNSYQAAVQALAVQGNGALRVGALKAAQEGLELVPLPASLGAALVLIKELFSECDDLVLRGLMIGNRPAALLFVRGLVKEERLELSVLEPLGRHATESQMPESGPALRTWLASVAIASDKAEPVKSVGHVVDGLLLGDAVLLVDGLAEGLKMAAQGWERRSVDKPVVESTVRGPQEGFTETILVNTSLLRRKLKSPHLKIERIVLGRQTRTALAVIYLKDVAAPSLVDEVKRRLRRIDVDGILDTGMIEEWIEDQPSSLFPQVSYTERPDRVAGNLLDGQVAILAEGSPTALTLPVTFWMLLQAGEDYYHRFWLASALRLLRALFLVVSLVGPSTYIAITTFHQEMIPTNLLLSIVASREGVPFPVMLEAILMEVFFEVLREAGLRLPRPMGQAISIVGALVLGQAAVQSGLVSTSVVITVAITGISSFIIPGYGLGSAIRLLRFPLMLLAGSLGLFGIMIGLLAILVHLCGLRSFGVPYLQPVAPLTWPDLRDVLLRAPAWLLGRRPAMLGSPNRRRQAPWLDPGAGGDGS
ncbi:MAG TPA: spore germination protein [Symbiobacteriaceae bacterium]|nr:spore germination protein [Symbiobacteriaceae bacterium]